SSAAALAFSEMSGAINIKGQIRDQLPTALNGGGSLSFQKVRIDGLDLGNVELVANVNGRAAKAEFLLGGAGTGLSLQLRAETEDVLDPDARVHLRGESATDGLRGPFALPVEMEMVGALSFDVTGTRRDLQALPAQISSGAVRAASGISGSLEISHVGVQIPANGLNAAFDGAMALSIDDRGWRVKPVAGLNVELGRVMGSGEQRLALTLDGMADVPFLAGGPGPADPYRLGMLFDGKLNDWFPFAGEIGGSVWPATTDGILLEDMAVRLDPWQMKLGGLSVVTDKVSARLSGPLQSLDMDVAADARFSGKLTPALAVSGGHVSITSQIGYTADGIKIFPEGCTEIRASRIDYEKSSLRPGPISLCPLAGGAPLIHAVMENGDGSGGLKRIDLAAALKSVEVAMQGVGAYPLSGHLPAFQGTASYDAQRGTWWAKLLSSGGDLRIEGPDIAVADVDGTFALEGRDTLLGARVDLKAARLIDHRRPLRFSPAHIDGQARYQPSNAHFTGHAGFADGPMSAIDARYRFHDGRGGIQVSLPTWTIDENGVQPQDLLPFLKGSITHVSGRLGGEASVNWAQSRVSSSGKISLGALAFGTTPAEVAGLNGEIVLDDLINPKTRGTQTITLALLDAGIPLRDGTIALTMPGDGSVRIDKAVWPLAGGTLDVIDLSISREGLPDVIIANIRDMDAGALARSVDIKGLEAEGTLAGSIPVRISADGPVIDDARIWSEKGGVLRFRSQGALQSLKQSGEMAELLAKALSDFRFSNLQMSLDGPLSGEITAKAKVDGANPALYDGKRIELNVSLQGALRDLLQSASVLDDLPETIRDRVKGPSGKPQEE
ncbi:MAG: YdbH domain-containing protein, partial [Rhodospirillales bacterium]